MKFTGTILLVDDESHIRKFVSLLLRQVTEARIIEAGSGEDAVRIYTEERPDLVLLDVNMPGMTGLDTLKRLMEIDPDCLAVMLTSLVSRQTVEQAASLGAVNYIRKDSPPNEVAQTLAEVIAECFDDGGESEPAAESNGGR